MRRRERRMIRQAIAIANGRIAHFKTDRQTDRQTDRWTITNVKNTLGHTKTKETTAYSHTD